MKNLKKNSVRFPDVGTIFSANNIIKMNYPRVSKSTIHSAIMGKLENGEISRESDAEGTKSGVKGRPAKMYRMLQVGVIHKDESESVLA